MKSAWEAARAGRNARIGARADLGLLTDEITGLVKVLDGLNRIRYQPLTHHQPDACPGPAPSAIRIPISRVRQLTLYATSP